MDTEAIVNLSGSINNPQPAFLLGRGDIGGRVNTWRDDILGVGNKRIRNFTISSSNAQALGVQSSEARRILGEGITVSIGSDTTNKEERERIRRQNLVSKFSGNTVMFSESIMDNVKTAAQWVANQTGSNLVTEGNSKIGFKKNDQVYSIANFKKERKGSSILLHPAWNIVNAWNRLMTAHKQITNSRLTDEGKLAERLDRRKAMQEVSAIKRAIQFANVPSAYEKWTAQTRKSLDDYTARVKQRLDFTTRAMTALNSNKI